MKEELIPIGTKTRFGEICAIGIVSGERYYWMIDKYGTVSMMPQCSMQFLTKTEITLKP